VLREMRDNPKRGHDPLLVKALINVTGVFPVGTLAILDSHSSWRWSPRATRTRSGCISPWRRSSPTRRQWCWLSPSRLTCRELDPATGSPRRTIVKTIDPDQYGIRVSDYFV
jgi:hypothetical protein